MMNKEDEENKQHFEEDRTKTLKLPSKQIIKNQLDNIRVFTIVVLSLGQEQKGIKYGFIEKLNIGRKVENPGLNINDKTISSHHCSLVVKDGKVYISDTKSRNGTYLAGKRLSPGEEHHLQPEDIFLLGQIEIQLGVVRTSDIIKENIQVIDKPKFKTYLEEMHSDIDLAQS